MRNRTPLLPLLAVLLAAPACAAKGEKLWTQACQNIFEVGMREAERRGRVSEPSADEIDTALSECLARFRELPPESADRKAQCALGKSDAKGVAACMTHTDSREAAAQPPPTGQPQ